MFVFLRYNSLNLARFSDTLQLFVSLNCLWLLLKQLFSTLQAVNWPTKISVIVFLVCVLLEGRGYNFILFIFVIFCFTYLLCTACMNAWELNKKRLEPYSLTKMLSKIVCHVLDCCWSRCYLFSWGLLTSIRFPPVLCVLCNLIFVSAVERIKPWQYKSVHWSMHWARTHLLSDAVL